MSEILSHSGARLVAATVRPYDFTARDGKQLKGDALALWLVTEFDAEPIKVKVREADRAAFETIQGEGFGCLLDVSYDVRADNNRLTRTLVSAAPAATPQRKPAAA